MKILLEPEEIKRSDLVKMEVIHVPAGTITKVTMELVNNDETFPHDFLVVQAPTNIHAMPWKKNAKSGDKEE